MKTRHHSAMLSGAGPARRPPLCGAGSLRAKRIVRRQRFNRPSISLPPLGNPFFSGGGGFYCDESLLFRLLTCPGRRRLAAADPVRTKAGAPRFDESRGERALLHYGPLGLRPGGDRPP